jgi:hypothetical protein
MLDRGCAKCHAPREALRIGRAQLASGATVYPWYCTRCLATTTIYAKKEVALRQSGVIDVLTATQRKGATRPPCEVCGAGGTELHHWAPRALFGEECDAWPRSWLCRGCHLRWHQLVTPGPKGKE